MSIEYIDFKVTEKDMSGELFLCVEGIDVKISIEKDTEVPHKWNVTWTDVDTGQIAKDLFGKYTNDFQTLISSSVATICNKTIADVVQ